MSSDQRTGGVDAPIVREATADDLPAVGKLGALLLRTHHAFDPARFIAHTDDAADGYAWFLGTQLKKRDAAVLVAEENGRIVGYAYATSMSLIILQMPKRYLPIFQK